MDRSKGITLGSIISKISTKELIGSEIQSNKLMYSVFGFLPACDFVDNAMLISNLGYMISQKGLNTCIVDLKVFYPNMYHYLDVAPNERASGLIKVLKSDKVDFRSEILTTKYDRLYLLSASPQDLMEEYYDFGFEQIERVIKTLKDMFDIVLIDIPNNPPLEFCLGAIKHCHMGFFTVAEKTEAMGNITKLLGHASSVGISTAKFTSVILMNLLGSEYDFKAINNSGFNIAAAIPFVKGANIAALEGELYMKDNALIHKNFRKEMMCLVEWLTNAQ